MNKRGYWILLIGIKLNEDMKFILYLTGLYFEILLIFFKFINFKMVDYLNVTMGHMKGVVTLGGEISLFICQDGHCNNTISHVEVSMCWSREIFQEVVLRLLNERFL